MKKIKITVKGEAKPNTSNKTKNLEEFDGISCKNCFSDYLHKSRCSAADVISGGYLRFEYSDGKLWSITEYDSERMLTEKEMEQLADYTQGQWSDGIGEGFEQRPCNDKGDYISPWFSEQEIEIFDNSDEIRDENIDTVLENEESEIENLNKIIKEIGVNKFVLMDLGMDLKDIYKDNYNYRIAAARALKFLKDRGFEVTFNG